MEYKSNDILIKALTSNNHNIANKISEVQRKILGAEKKAIQGLKYSAPTSSQVDIITKNALRDEGLVLTSQQLNVDYSFMNNKTVVCKVEMLVTITDIKTGDYQHYLTQGIGTGMDGKCLGSAMSYGLKYFKLKLFAIPTDQDDPDFKTESSTVKGKIKQIKSGISKCLEIKIPVIKVMRTILDDEYTHIPDGESEPINMEELVKLIEVQDEIALSSITDKLRNMFTEKKNSISKNKIGIDLKGRINSER